MTEAVRLLLDKGASIDSTDNYGLTALYFGEKIV
jgi:ankyrin repeat protein